VSGNLFTQEFVAATFFLYNIVGNIGHTRAIATSTMVVPTPINFTGTTTGLKLSNNAVVL
jgi:hypothetical protein